TVLETGCPGTPSQRSSQRRTDLFTSRRQRILIDESEPESSAPPGKRAVRLISLWRPSRLRSPRRNSPAPSGPRQCVGLALAAAARSPHPPQALAGFWPWLGRRPRGRRLTRAVVNGVLQQPHSPCSRVIELEDRREVTDGRVVERLGQCLYRRAPDVMGAQQLDPLGRGPFANERIEGVANLVTACVAKGGILEWLEL